MCGKIVSKQNDLKYVGVYCVKFLWWLDKIDLCEWYKKRYNKAKGLFISARWNKKVLEKRELIKMLSRVV